MTPSARWIGALGLAAAGWAGCPYPAECRRVTERAPDCDVGTGQSGFEPLEDGAALEIVHGPQGGIHVYGALRVEGLFGGQSTDLSDDSLPRVSFQVLADGIQIAGYPSLPRVFSQGDDGSLLLWGEALVLDAANAETVVGLPVELRATVVDACGTAVEGSATGILADVDGM